LGLKIPHLKKCRDRIEIEILSAHNLIMSEVCSCLSVGKSLLDLDFLTHDAADHKAESLQRNYISLQGSAYTAIQQIYTLFYCRLILFIYLILSHMQLQKP